MNRRGFLGSILAAGVAPVFVPNALARGIWMPVREIVRPQESVTLTFPNPPTFEVFIDGVKVSDSNEWGSLNDGILTLKPGAAGRRLEVRNIGLQSLSVATPVAFSIVR